MLIEKVKRLLFRATMLDQLAKRTQLVTVVGVSDFAGGVDNGTRMFAAQVQQAVHHANRFDASVGDQAERPLCCVFSDV
ncbi:hypothetical protein ACFL2H_11780 [Planctomycetota bacterium]